MITKLRRKFVAIAMCSVFAVLFLIIGSVVTVSYLDVIDTAERRIDVIAEHNGIFPKFSDFPEVFDKGRMSVEAAFDTRYFTVSFTPDGEVLNTDTGKIAAIDSDTAVSLAEDIYRKNRDDGFCGDYRYKRVSRNSVTMLIFLDCSREMDTFESFAVTSALASIFGLTLVFILVLVFSKIAVKPVAESYEKQKRFITDASHELKTPLTIIGAANDVMELDTGENEWTKSIKNQIKRLTGLTEKLVMLSRMDEEGYCPQKTTLNLSSLCEETAHSFDAVAASKNKFYSVSVEPDITYSGDETTLRQLISLLLDNAMKYSDERGSIEVSLRRNGRYCELTVKNSVNEIKKGNWNILFERFYRSDDSRSSQTGGHGIGLSVAKAIVLVHKGKINACSPDGKSLVFTVQL